MKNKEHLIKNVKPGSIAFEMEIEPGDILVSINGEEMDDIFDYQLLCEDEYIEIVIKKQNYLGVVISFQPLTSLSITF